MISLSNATKCFGEVRALQASLDIPEGSAFGLLGTNGAGKSTLLRLVSGVYRPDEGSVCLDGEDIYENIGTKQQVFLVSDEAGFSPGSTGLSLARFYEGIYPAFDRGRFLSLCQSFTLDPTRPFRSLSKGMRKQVHVLLGVAAGTQYLLCDETFDGLDPVMRQAVKSLFASEMDQRGLTPILATHNLRELEDFCDHLGLLHKGEVILKGNLDTLKEDLWRIQCAFSDTGRAEELISRLDTLKVKREGRLHLITARGKREELSSLLDSFSPLYGEIVPLTLEEIFIAETEAVGYEIELL